MMPPHLIQIVLLGFGKASFLLVFILLYKTLSLADSGLLAVAYAIAVVLATISECGLRGLLVREMARNTGSVQNTRLIMAGAIKSRLFTLLPYLATGYLTGVFFLPDWHWEALFLILGAAWLDSNAFVFRGVLRAFDFIRFDALLAAGTRLVLLLLTATLYWNQQLTLRNFAVIFALVAFADLVTTLSFVVLKTRIPLTLASSFNETIALVKRGTPFIILNLIGILYIRVGILALGVSHSDAGLEEAAAFSLSAKIPEGVSFLPIALMNAAIPYFARNSGNISNIIPTFRKLELVMGSAGIIISAGLIFFAEEFILLLATPGYLAYKTVFQIYGLTTFFSFLQYVYANLLICMDHEKTVARRYGIVLTLNMVLNLFLVWKLEALGAVLALLICEIAAVAIDMRFILKTGIRFDASLLIKWGSLIVACCMAGYAAHHFSYPYNMAIYWILGGLTGLILLLKCSSGPGLFPGNSEKRSCAKQ